MRNAVFSRTNKIDLIFIKASNGETTMAVPSASKQVIDNKVIFHLL
jgi:hypothetical protein